MTLDREELFDALNERLYGLMNGDDGITGRVLRTTEIWQLTQARTIIDAMLLIVEGRTQLRLSRPERRV